VVTISSVASTACDGRPAAPIAAERSGAVSNSPVEAIEPRPQRVEHAGVAVAVGGDQRVGHCLVPVEQLLPLRRIPVARRRAARRVDQRVGHLAHRRGDDHYLVALGRRGDGELRGLRDPLGGSHGGTAEFHDYAHVEGEGGEGRGGRAVSVISAKG
jgi:hypothetical protein